MKNLAILLLFLLSAFAGMELSAQVVLDFSQYEALSTATLKFKLVDAHDKEPLPYASVYLVPENDSTIAHFALSDDKGIVRIEEIIKGKYKVNAEMVGYKPYSEIKEINRWEVDLGTVALEIDKEMLDAAKVSASGNAVMIKGDTLVYNASAFHVGENAMLGDLLKKMPGVKVDDDGSVTVNGEKVDRITVGGKTFFFSDPTMAVTNLPAKIVEKIQIVDKEKDAAEFSGVSAKDDKEKVMDVGLKKEFSKGWFGNIAAGGGSTVASNSKDGVSDNTGGLYSANALVAGYNEKDQLTIIGNGGNYRSSSSRIVMYDEASDDFTSRPGITTSAKGGFNYNTERIKGLESNVSASYTYSHKDSREKSVRTSFIPDRNDLISESKYKGAGEGQKVSIDLEFKKKDMNKVLFQLRPNFTYSKSYRDQVSAAVTKDADKEMNSSATSSFSNLNRYTGKANLMLGVKDFGKARRSLIFNGYFGYMGTGGDSFEQNKTVYSSVIESKRIDYDLRGRYSNVNANLAYVEPVGEKWSIEVRFSTTYSNNLNDKDASDADSGSPNPYYSTYSKNMDLLFSERLLAQYNKDKTKVSFGVQADQDKNETVSRISGVESKTGFDQWIYNWSPFADIQFSKEKLNFKFYVAGHSYRPAGTLIVPALDFTNPIQITSGNIYLRPQYQQYFYSSFRYSHPEKQVFASLYLNGNLEHSKIVKASWFDDNGVRYAIPVNTKKPGLNFDIYANFSFPLDNQKNLSLGIFPGFDFSREVSYQARGVLPGLNKESFDYKETMDNIWGDANGSLFYSGQSGFAESRTKTSGYFLTVDLTYSLDDFDINVSGSADYEISKYSLDPNANLNIWDFAVLGDFIWYAPKDWELETDLSYTFYKGYSDGYGKPEFIWNITLSKSIKAFTLSLTASDILNQERSMHRVVTSGYKEESYRNILGRYIVVSLKYNFGKMNAKNSQKAQSAMFMGVF